MLYRQLILLWESASWVDIERLVNADKLPHFKQFCGNGTAGRLTSVEPVNFTTGAVSLATGEAPCDHGIIGRLCLTPDKLRVKQHQAADWKPLWQQLQLSQQLCISVNWPVTHPVTDSPHAILSDRYSQFGRHAYRFCTPADSVSQGVNSDLVALLNQARIQPDEISDEILAEFFQCPPSSFDDPLLALELRYIVAQIYTSNAASLLLLEHQKWDCAWINFSGLIEILELLKSKKVSAQYRDCIYQVFDQLLGVMLSKLDDDVMVHIVSSQSVTSEAPDVNQGVGIWAIRGGSVISDRVIHGAHVLDIAPTILALRSASSSHCEHQPRKDLFSDFPDEIKTESTPIEKKRTLSSPPYQHLLEDGNVSNLFSPEDRFSNELLNKTGHYIIEGKFHSLLQMQRFEQAEEMATTMLKQYPDSGVAQINYGYCLFASKKHDELEQFLATLSLELLPEPIRIEIKILNSKSQLSLSNKSAAIELANELLKLPSISLAQRLKIAGIYRDLGEYQQAIAIYERLIKDNSNWIIPQSMLAITLLKAHHYKQAEIIALAALKIDFTNERMQYTLAIARLRQGSKALAQAGLNDFVTKTGGTRLINRILKWT